MHVRWLVRVLLLVLLHLLLVLPLFVFCHLQLVCQCAQRICSASRCCRKMPVRRW